MNDAHTVARALRLLESQRRASQSYYLRNKEVIKEKSLNYWKEHKDAINTRRRLVYARHHTPAQLEAQPEAQPLPNQEPELR
jgi:hypothetical protein